MLASVVFGLGALGWNALIYVSAGERVDPSLASRSVAVAATVVFVLSAVVTPVLGALVAYGSRESAVLVRSGSRPPGSRSSGPSWRGRCPPRPSRGRPPEPG